MRKTRERRPCIGTGKEKRRDGESERAQECGIVYFERDGRIVAADAPW